MDFYLDNIFCWGSIPGESKKVQVFGGLWNEKYVTDIENGKVHLSVKGQLR